VNAGPFRSFRASTGGRLLTVQAGSCGTKFYICVWRSQPISRGTPSNTQEQGTNNSDEKE
jgi:hypothetical protein